MEGASNQNWDEGHIDKKTIYLLEGQMTPRQKTLFSYTSPSNSLSEVFLGADKGQSLPEKLSFSIFKLSFFSIFSIEF